MGSGFINQNKWCIGRHTGNTSKRYLLTKLFLMSISKIPDPVKWQLWGKAAGCCQYENCAKPLYLDALTKAEFNIAYIAHIIADKPNGPRGHPVLSKLLSADISNLMLLCDEHHRLIDRVQVNEHSVERLVLMKKTHEERVAKLVSITPDKQSHVVMYGANIGAHGSPLCYKEACGSMLPERYPAHARAIELGIKNSTLTDDMLPYWEFQESQLVNAFNKEIASLKGNHEIQHFSVFGLAPMPLLIKLGTLFSDLYDVDVYQRHREPATWQWQPSIEVGKDFFKLIPPSSYGGAPALNLSLSGTITPDRITSVMGVDASVWNIKHTGPHNDFLRSKDHLASFRTIMRRAFDVIKEKHGQTQVLSLFPAMPVATSIELGRVWMPKADMPLQIYDQNKNVGSFIKTLTIK
jgi:hypothetical protein